MRNMSAWQAELQALGFKLLYGNNIEKGYHSSLLYCLNDFLVAFGTGHEEWISFKVVEKRLVPNAPKVSEKIIFYLPVQEYRASTLITEDDIETEDQVLSVIEAIIDPSLAPTLAGIEWATPLMERLLK